MNHTKHNQGLTLLEMAIVLMIIAVIAAGVLLGRSLLVSSQLQTVMTDADNYIKVIDNFKQAHGGLPGDLPNAESLWGTDSIGCPAGGGSTGTCNGNGDGKIGPFCNGSIFDVIYAYEAARVWQHLNSAGLYINALTGINPTSGSGDIETVAGVNTPKGAIDGSAFVAMWLDTQSPATCTTAGLLESSGPYGNSVILVGKVQTWGNDTMDTTPILTTDQASQIDAKIDDGVPATGKVKSFGWGGSGTNRCTTTDVGSTAAYDLTRSGRLCSLIFATGY